VAIIIAVAVFSIAKIRDKKSHLAVLQEINVTPRETTMQGIYFLGLYDAKLVRYLLLSLHLLFFS